MPWQVLGRSAQDRVIEFARFGQGPYEVLVVGPLAGDEGTPAQFANLLAAHLATFPRSIEGARVTVVADPNPDGRNARRAGNAHGVLLDRNFPTNRWRKLPEKGRWASGRQPESEPETRLLVDLLNDLRPQRVIVLAGSPRDARLSCAPSPGDHVSRLAIAAGLAAGTIDAAAEAGSLATLTGIDRGIPTVRLQLPVHSSAEESWNRYKRIVLSAIATDPAIDDADERQSRFRDGMDVTGARREPGGVLSFEAVERGIATVPVMRKAAPRAPAGD